MRKTWKLHVAAILAAGALAAGCSSQDKGEQRAAGDANSSAQTVSLTGCVGTAPGSAGGLALQQVQMTPMAQQPSDAVTTTSNNAITEGSWVRLAMGGDNDDLRKHVGQRVTIVGAIQDDGRSTIGTSGGPQAAPQQGEPRQDQSRAAANEHYSEKVAKQAGPMGQSSMSNGTAPQILVHRIEGTGQPCSTDLMQPENRR